MWKDRVHQDPGRGSQRDGTPGEDRHSVYRGSGVWGTAGICRPWYQVCNKHKEKLYGLVSFPLWPSDSTYVVFINGNIGQVSCILLGSTQREVMGSIPVGNSDFFFVPRSCDVYQFTFHISLLSLKFTISIHLWTIPYQSTYWLKCPSHSV